MHGHHLAHLTHIVDKWAPNSAVGEVVKGAGIGALGTACLFGLVSAPVTLPVLGIGAAVCAGVALWAELGTSAGKPASPPEIDAGVALSPVSPNPPATPPSLSNAEFEHEKG